MFVPLFPIPDTDSVWTKRENCSNFSEIGRSYLLTQGSISVLSGDVQKDLALASIRSFQVWNYHALFQCSFWLLSWRAWTYGRRAWRGCVWIQLSFKKGSTQTCIFAFLNQKHFSSFWNLSLLYHFCSFFIFSTPFVLSKVCIMYLCWLLPETFVRIALQVKDALILQRIFPVPFLSVCVEEHVILLLSLKSLSPVGAGLSHSHWKQKNILIIGKPEGNLVAGHKVSFYYIIFFFFPCF